MKSHFLIRSLLYGPLTVMLAIGSAGALGGCAHSSTVPTDARRIHVGQGAVRTRAKQDGLVWVKDETAGKVVWAGDVHRGDAIVLDAAGGTLTVGAGTTVLKNLDAGHQYAVYEEKQ